MTETNRSLLKGTDAERAAILAELLTVKPVAHDIFVAPRMPDGLGRIFGGQVVAQALAAARQTVDEERQPHSLHAYFLRGGDEAYPIEMRVERDFDGGSFSNRRVIASQNGTPILNLIASFQRHSAAPSWPVRMPDVPGPEGLIDELDSPARKKAVDLGDRVPALIRHRAFEMRIPLDHWTGGKAPKGPTFFWFRVTAPLSDDMAVHRLALTYLSDYGLLATALVNRGIRIRFDEARMASLDHALWFHAEARVDDWLCFVTDSPFLGAGRALTRGQFFTRDGTLVATASQEGMIRLPEGSYTPPGAD